MSGSCVILLLCDNNVKEVKSQTFKLKPDENTRKESFAVKNLMEQHLKFCLTLCYCFIQCLQGWNSQVWCCTLILISVFWIMHWKNGARLCHMKMIKWLRTLSFPLKNGLKPYSWIMPSLPKRNRWPTLWRNRTPCRSRTLVTDWKHSTII